MRWMIAMVTLGALGACGGDDGPADSALLGIYAVDAWTENTAGCAAEGPSILADQPETMFVLTAGSFFGQGFLGASPCADQAACEAQAMDDAIDLSGWLFEAGSDAAGWTGRVTVAYGTGDPDGCEGRVTDHTLTSTGATTVRIESRTRTAAWTGRDAEGFCDTDRAQAEAEDQPCAELEVVAATRTVDL